MPLRTLPSDGPEGAAQRKGGNKYVRENSVVCWRDARARESRIVPAQKRWLAGISQPYHNHSRPFSRSARAVRSVSRARSHTPTQPHTQTHHTQFGVSRAVQIFPAQITRATTVTIVRCSSASRPLCVRRPLGSENHRCYTAPPHPRTASVFHAKHNFSNDRDDDDGERLCLRPSRTC